MLKLHTFSGPYFKSPARLAGAVVCHALPNHSRSSGVSFLPALLLVNVHLSSTRAGTGLGKVLLNLFHKEELRSVTGGSAYKSISS